MSAILDKEVTYHQIGNKVTYKLIESKGIAFDHAEILLTALDHMTKHQAL